MRSCMPLTGGLASLADDAPAMILGSAFSGIGGLDLAVLAALGLPVDAVAWHVESNDYCRRVLAKRFPGARRVDDVRAPPADLERIDVLCGGPPCQPISRAGKRAGGPGRALAVARDVPGRARGATPLGSR